MSIRIIVTGREGQLVRALREAAKDGIVVVPVGRPDLDLERPETALPVLTGFAPDVIVNAAAYTAVDRAEKESGLALMVNAKGAGAVASAAKTLKVPVIQISTDYVFDGKKKDPYTETDAPLPESVYGGTKLLGEMMVAEATEDYAIVRTSWVYSPYGKNFVRTMVGLAAKTEEVRVVADQRGSPTYAPDLAEAILRIARTLKESPDPKYRGLFHFAGTGETTWAEFARSIFLYLSAQGRSAPEVVPISSADYPGAAKRPENSRLDCTKLARVFNIVAPPWPDSLGLCLDRL